MFNDGLAHLSRADALRWCAERDIRHIEMGVGGWRQADHLDLDALLRDAGERDRLLGELREHGIELVCVNAAGNPLHPDAAVGERHAALLRGAVELAALVGCDRVVTMSGCPGGRDGGSTPVFASWPVVPDDESLWEWQYEHRLAPFWRELAAWAAHGGPERDDLPRAPRRRVGLQPRLVRADPRGRRPQRRREPRPEPLLVAGDGSRSP